MRTTGLWLALLALSACSDEDPLLSSPAPSTPRDAASASKDAGVSSTKKDAASSSAKNEPKNSVDAATGTATPAEPEICNGFKIQNGRLIPNMLIVLDRSSSMKSGLVNRWDPSVSGLKAITSALDDVVSFGLMAFPGSGGQTGGRGVSCAAGTLEVDVKLNAGDEIAQHLDALQLVETTPTAATLEAAHASLNALEPPADGVVPPLYVVLVTDGAPNCGDGSNGGLRGGLNDQVAVQASISAISGMASDKIKTYVLGYDTASDPQLASTLDAMAVAGATGDTMHRSISDEAGLIAAFREITKSVLSCEYKLDEAPADPSYVKVTLEGELLRYDDPNGWQLSDDKRTLTLLGDACTAISDGTRIHNLSVEVQCEMVQYL